MKQGLRVLKSFVGVVKVKYQDVEFSLDVDSETGIADNGTLTRDLAELFVATGEAAESRKSSIVILIDEIQNLLLSGLNCYHLTCSFSVAQIAAPAEDRR